MMRAGKSHVGMPKSFVPRIHGLAALLLCAGLLAAVGCKKKPEPPTPPPPEPLGAGYGQPADLNAKLATISATFSVNPGRLDLSKGLKDRYQWHNTSSVELLVVFKNSGSEYFPGRVVIPAGQFSAVFQVCECPKGLYEYRLFRLVGADWVEAIAGGAPPTVPEVSVGD